MVRQLVRKSLVFLIPEPLCELLYTLISSPQSVVSRTATSACPGYLLEIVLRIYPKPVETETLESGAKQFVF